MLARMKAVAAAENLPFGDRTMTYNSRLAQELGHWAENQGRGDAFHHAVFRAYFAGGQNIADIDVLTRIAGEVGLSPAEAAGVLSRRDFRSSVDRDWENARQVGVTAVPTLVAGNRALVGARPYADMAALAEAAGIPRRTG
jgi:predicted DsbA family dithiol-disulfide isomerase